jgi:hypothetical protein
VRFAVRNRAGMWRAEPRRVRVVRAIEDVAACLAEELIEHRLDRREVRVVIEMLLLDVQHDGVLGMVKRERAVTLIAFGDEVLALRIPVRVRAENGNLRADVVRRVQAADFQDVRRHR